MPLLKGDEIRPRQVIGRHWARLSIEEKMAYAPGKTAPIPRLDDIATDDSNSETEDKDEGDQSAQRVRVSKVYQSQTTLFLFPDNQ